MKPKPLAFIPAIAWFFIIMILLMLPPSDLPSESFLDIIFFDKWVHAGLFGGMVFLAAIPFIGVQQLSKKLLIKITIASALYGVAMEYAQKYIATDRDFDYWDMLADAVGCVICYFLMLYINKVYKKRKAI